MNSMLKAILVDDDYPVLRYLSDAVEWHQLGIQLTGSYSNGLEAWEAAGEQPPDIILTDIGMPKMNGLEMLGKFIAVKPDVRAVILSCHNEFKYAQQAIKLNVNDYLLKENLDVVELQLILKGMAAELSEQKRQAESLLLYKQKQTMNVSALKEKFLKDTLFQSSWPKEDWLERASSMGVSLNAKWHVPLVLVINRMSELSRSREMNEYTIAFSVENVLQDVLSPDKWPLFRYSNNQLVVLCLADEPEKELGEIYCAMRDGMAAIERYLRFSVTCLTGRPARTPKELRESLLPMVKERDHSFYLKEAGVHRFEVKSFPKGDIFAHYADLFAVINKNIALNQPEELRGVVGKWTSDVMQQSFHPGDVKEFVLQLLMDLQMKTKVKLQHDPFLTGEKLHDTVHAIETLDHLEEWLIHYLIELSRKLSVFAVTSSRPEVIKAQQFVIEHVTEKISLEEMAGYLNLNASYFSRLFKKETDQNFIEYVNMVKLQKAKELLQHSNKGVEEISDYLGYANKSYFIKLFKREMGMRPSEFSAWKS